MAVGNNYDHFKYTSDIFENSRGYTIKGVMLYTSILVDKYDMPAYEIKEILARNLVEHLLRNDLIEFTQESRMGDVLCRGRIFVLPNEQTQVIRRLGKFDPTLYLTIGK